MAKPAFIYAFDNLGPYRFAELCGVLLGSRCRGFMLGGEGADGGIDGKTDKILGVWQPEYEEDLQTDIIQPDQTVVFQFKHVGTARRGESKSREELIGYYKCKSRKKCELHSKLVQEKKPSIYILVTNVEINNQFREKFEKTCKAEEPSINHYRIIGLDELVSWIEMLPELRHLYFPTIFGMPRFNLRINISIVPNPEDRLLIVDVLNVGTVPSYLDTNSIKFFCIIKEKREDFGYLIKDSPKVTSEAGIKLEPGRKYTYILPPVYFATLKKYIEKNFGINEKIYPTEIQIQDEIGNVYAEKLDEDKKVAILEYMRKEY